VEGRLSSWAILRGRPADRSEEPAEIEFA